MLKLAADQNFNNKILRGLQQRLPDLDIVRVQDSEAAEADDPAVLAWAAGQGRILLTHDVNTMVGYAYDRLRAGQSMAGVLEVRDKLPIGQVIEDMLLLVTCTAAEEWEGRYAIYLCKVM